jgi:hypothetical protein
VQPVHNALPKFGAPQASTFRKNRNRRGFSHDSLKEIYVEQVRTPRDEFVKIVQMPRPASVVEVVLENI